MHGRAHRLQRRHRTSIIPVMIRVSLAFCGCVSVITAGPAQAGEYSSTVLVSKSSTGASATGASRLPVLSGDAGYAFFQSQASNLGVRAQDIVARDLASGSVSVVSVGLGGAAANGASGSAVSSESGRYVAFVSDASNLVADDGNGAHDVFVADRTTGTITAVSVGVSGRTADGDSHSPSISGDGRYVAFVSSASDLVAGDAAGHHDVFVRDLVGGTTSRLSNAVSGVPANGDSSAPAISLDGSTVAFSSLASDLVAGDSNGVSDVFVVARTGGPVRRASIASDGRQAALSSFSPSLDRTGTRVAFESAAANLVTGDTNLIRDVFVRDISAGTTVRASQAQDGRQGDAESREARIAADGSRVAFVSLASNFVPGDTNRVSDVFITDLATGYVSRISNARAGGAASGASSSPAFSSAGDAIAFQSDASDIAVGDTNGATDVFVARFGTRSYDRVAGRDRYATAIEASRRAFPNGAPVVVVATGGNWPDALGGSALAGVAGGPLLLVHPSGITPAVADEIERLGATRAYILGGTTSVSATTQKALVTLVGSVTRLGGRDRYAAAAAIGAEVVRLQGGAWDGTALVATGGGYPDALAGSPVAAASGRPIVLVQPANGSFELPAGTDRAVILGGPASVTPAVETALTARFGRDRVSRLGGRDRYEAAATIAQWGVDDVGLSWDHVSLATGEKFPDALSGGVMAGRLGSVVMLTRGAGLSSAASARLAGNAGLIGTVHIVGGPASVSDRTMHSMQTVMGD